MPSPGRSARETLRLADQADAPAAPPWALFDADWYRVRYPDAPDGSAEALLEWHLSEGQTLGHAPNRYFDEMWQRQTWPGIQARIESGSVASAFDAWCRGPHATRAPHWLFNPGEYRGRYPAQTDEVLAKAGLINRYHHYLRFGAAEGRIGHVLFEPAVYLATLDAAERDAARSNPFLHYLRAIERDAPERRTSLLFDPDWYREHYPQAAKSVADGQYRCMLMHYLCNERPAEFDPSPWFSEQHYLKQNQGVAEAIGHDEFRNGFAHFLAHGLREGRSPHPDLDLSWYAGRDEVRADIEAGLARDAFIHWITLGHPAGVPGRDPPKIQLSEAQAIALYQQRADSVWPLFGRHKLDFTHDASPALSVILRLRDRLADTLVSLASLRAGFGGAIELILIDSAGGPGALDIETHVAGATIPRIGRRLDDAAARQAGLVCATAPAVLLLGDGIDPAPGAIESALRRLRSDAAIGAVGGRLIQPHGALLEAGGIVWRDGRSQGYLRGAPPSAGEANFVRDVDYCSTLFLLARRAVLASLPEQQPGLAGTTHDAADLCARIRQSGFRIVYDPDVVAFLTSHSTGQPVDGQAAFVAAHPAWLASRPAFDPDAVIRARSPCPARPRVLVIEDSIPLRRIGAGFVRSNDILRAMAALGASVTVVPMRRNHFPLSVIRADLPDTAEVMHEMTARDLAAFIAARRDDFDVFWVGRTHNQRIALTALAGMRAGENGAGAAAQAGGPAVARSNEAENDAEAARQAAGADGTPEFDPASAQGAAAVADTPPGWPAIIVDTEAVTAVVQAGQAALRQQPFDLDAALRQELGDLGPAVRVVAVSEADAALVRARHAGKVSVLGHAMSATPTPRPFGERNGILFVGAFHGQDDPNLDGLTWFVDEVLPLVERMLRWETRVTVAGYTAPGVSLDRFRSHGRVTLAGTVADLAPLYDAHRVFIAPARFAAGLPWRVHEAAAFGLPVVTTRLVADQLGWRDAEALGAADATDPPGFAARVIALHRDVALWTRLREAALARVEAELDPRAFTARLAEILGPWTTNRDGVRTPSSA